MDDGPLTANSSTITDHKDMVIHTLEDLWFSINYSKSHLEESHTIEWIGYIKVKVLGYSLHPVILLC